MKRMLLVLTALALAVALPGVAAADHEAPAPGVNNAPLSSGINSGGEGVTWELITTLQSGNPHTDLDFFTQDGKKYVSVGTLAAGANGGGQMIHQLTDENGEVVPQFVSHHPSAACPTLATGVTGLQHDVEAAPKGNVPFNTDWNGTGARGDAQLLVDTTDAPGRCHDDGGPGPGGPQGGLEIIDVTDISDPDEIALISHIGEAHTVNIDPKRPHIAYAVSSDAVGFSGGERANEDPNGSPLTLDGFEVVDLSSCMNYPDDATIQQKRGVDDAGNFIEGEGCRPQVYRYRYPRPEITLGHTTKTDVYGCHELEVYPDDLLTCGGGGAAALFDMSGAFDDNGTPHDFTDDRPRGQPLPCRVRASTSQGTPTAAPIIDCVEGEETQDGEFTDLTVPGWLDIGAPSLEGVEHLGSAHHMGRGGPFPATEDIDFNHESELTHTQDFILATDERGGGVTPPGASCSPGADNTDGNGGIHAYAVDRLDTELPPEPGDQPMGEAYDPYARTPEGDKVVFRFEPKVPAPSFCTAHVFHQIPGQNRIFMAWYSQGTVVLDYVEHPDGTFEFKEAGYFIPEDANQWVSQIFKTQKNDDGTVTYWGATGDFRLANGGRQAVDIYEVTMPPAPEPQPAVACPFDEVPDSGFTDVARSVHKSNIECVAWYEVTEGVTAETYVPDDPISRGQMASFLARLAVEGGVELPGNPVDAFTDDGDSVHQDAINALAALDIVSGVGGGNYDPSANVTRAQMATFIANVYEEITGSLPASPQDAFDDDNDSIHQDSINALAALAIVAGRQDTDDVDGDGDTDEKQYFPGQDVSRAGMGTFMAESLRRLADVDAIIPGGARVSIDGDTTTAGGDISGTVESSKPLESLTALGCGLEDQEVTIADDGSFTVTIGSEESEDCRLTFDATTRRRGADTDGQTIDQTFDITIESGDGGGGQATAGGFFATW